MSYIAALVLAAGYSSRMGDFKPLLPLGETSVLASTIKTFSVPGISQILAVVGHRAEDLRPMLKDLKVQVIYNPGYAKGMFSSVQAGVNSLPPD